MASRAALRWILAFAALTAGLSCASNPKPGAPAVPRGFVGVVIARPEQAYLFKAGGYPLPGLIIRRILPNSPASQSELRVGDVIHRIDDRDVDDLEPEAFLRLLAVPPGQAVTLTVRHGFQFPPSPEHRIRLVAANGGTAGYPTVDAIDLSPPAATRSYAFETQPAVIPSPFGGFEPTPLPPAGSGFLGIEIRARDFNIGPIRVEGRGLLVQSILPHSPASNSELRAGDVIVGVAGIRTAHDDALAFIYRIAALRPNTVTTLTVRRDEEFGTTEKTIQIEVGARPAPESLPAFEPDR